MQKDDSLASMVVWVSEVNARLARLVLGWVTVFGQANNSHYQLSRSIRSSHPFVGMHNDYQVACLPQ